MITHKTRWWLVGLVATSLENYAALLRKIGRADEATEMEGRAREDPPTS